MNRIEFFSANSTFAAESIFKCISEDTPKNVNLVNAYSLATAEKSGIYQPYLLNTSVNLYDGFLVALISKILCKSAINETTRGADVFRAMIDLDKENTLRHFFICGSAEIEEQLRLTLSRLEISIHIAGVWIPDQNFQITEFNQNTLTNLLKSHSNIIWVGLGTPKQDRLSALITESTDVTTIGIGAALEFFSGLRKECPKAFRALKLEWLFRLLQEPSRLWRRYSIEMIFFLRALIKNRYYQSTNIRNYS